MQKLHSGRLDKSPRCFRTVAVTHIALGPWQTWLLWFKTAEGSGSAAKVVPECNMFDGAR